MKYIIMSLLITLFCINFSFAQNGPTSREIISGSSSSGSSFSSSYKEIRSRTARDAKLNKLGLTTLKKQIGDGDGSRVSVISTTALGNNKTLHVVELGGQRMLIGACSSSIHLIKDLGQYPPCEIKEGEFSKIEIPNIRIPKIEIPKIEIPGFTKVVSKINDDNDKQDPAKNEADEESNNDTFEISDIYEEENSDGIIDKLFHTAASESSTNTTTKEDLEHKVDPEEFALYKKYLS